MLKPARHGSGAAMDAAVAYVFMAIVILGVNGGAAWYLCGVPRITKAQEETEEPPDMA